VISAFLLLAWLVASWMLVPAVACDGADAFDACSVPSACCSDARWRAAPRGGRGRAGRRRSSLLVWIVADLGVGFAGAVAGLAGESASAVVTGSAAMAEEGGTRGTASARPS
jgi:hypothetical protein